VAIERLDVAVNSVAFIVPAGLAVSGTVEGEDHVVCAELSKTVVELDTFSQLKGPGLLVLRRLPVERQIRLDLFHVDGTGNGPDEPTVDMLEDGFVHGVGAGHGIEPADVAGIDAIAHNRAFRGGSIEVHGSQSEGRPARNAKALQEGSTVDDMVHGSFLLWFSARSASFDDSISWLDSSSTERYSIVFGSKTSRNPSPIMLKASTTIKIAIPGASDSHGSLRS